MVYHYDLAGQLIAETTDSGTPLRSVIWATNLPVAQIDSTPAGEDITYLHTDHLNTPRVGTDVNGTVVWHWQGEAFGTSAASEDPDGDGIPTVINLRFPGQYHDAESGLHYNWHRYYDPSMGRYITSDPIGLKGGLNAYGYADGNPKKWVDPDGLEIILGSVCTIANAALTANHIVNASELLDESINRMANQLGRINDDIESCPKNDIRRLAELINIKNELEISMLDSLAEQIAKNITGPGELLAGATREALCLALFAVPAP